MKFPGCRVFVVGALLTLSILAARPQAAKPTASDALRLAPIQPGVELDQPDADLAARCEISAERAASHVGWVVYDPNGITLRRFVDTNGDNVVDQWCYFKDGMEVYRDVDSDFNGKADQYRWFHTAGSRWGIDRNEDGTIDFWKTISAEEVTAEVIAALAKRDPRRFARLVLTPSEAKSLGLGPARTKALAEKIENLEKQFRDLAGSQKSVASASKWAQFSGNRPGVVPAGTEGATKDIRVYENVVAIFRNGEEHGQVQIGTLVNLGDTWRVIDLPQPIGIGQQEVAFGGFFFQGPMARQQEASSAEPSELFQNLLADLEKLDSVIAQATSAEQRARLNAQRADLHDKIAEAAPTRDDRAMWIRQSADTVSAEAQSGGYPEGPARLERLLLQLKKNPADRGLAAYVRFRQLTAEYAIRIQSAEPSKMPEVQQWWFGTLEDYVDEYPDTADTAEAILQYAMAKEFAGDDEEAEKWYARVVDAFPETSAAVKAEGAQTRLNSVGRKIQLKGKSLDGRTVDLAQHLGRVVLIQYWATWCGPCKTDMALLKDLVAEYGSSKLSVIGVNLDSSLNEAREFLASYRLPWPQIYEEGGLDSRPANEMGILTLPTMILIGQDGKVVNRNVHVAELPDELEKLIR
jgi:thiol-disulfide isomerase/thioredoxin